MTPDPKEVELKPCPFCGYPDVCGNEVILCLRCGATGPDMRPKGPGAWAWNRRSDAYQEAAFQARLAEKEADVERLKNGNEEQVHSLNRQIQRLYSAKEAAERQAEAVSLKLAQTEKQVAALREAAAQAYRAIVYTSGVSLEFAAKELKKALDSTADTVETAEAHDARVRAEAFEEAAKIECHHCRRETPSLDLTDSLGGQQYCHDLYGGKSICVSSRIWARASAERAKSDGER